MGFDPGQGWVFMQGRTHGAISSRPTRSHPRKPVESGVGAKLKSGSHLFAHTRAFKTGGDSRGALQSPEERRSGVGGPHEKESFACWLGILREDVLHYSRG